MQEVNNLTEEELKAGKTDNIIQMGLNQNGWKYADDFLKRCNKKQLNIIIQKAERKLEKYKWNYIIN